MEFKHAENGFEDAFAVVDEKAFVSIGVLVKRFHLVGDHCLTPDDVLVAHEGYATGNGVSLGRHESGFEMTVTYGFVI